jgi:hypothetical protein
MSIKITVLNSVPLRKVLEEVMGGEHNINTNKWKIDLGDNIQVSDEKWYNWNHQKGGVGAISLVKHWLECQNIDKNKIREEIINILTPFNEKLMLKKELDETLKNNNTQSSKLKI